MRRKPQKSKKHENLMKIMVFAFPDLFRVYSVVVLGIFLVLGSPFIWGGPGRRQNPKISLKTPIQKIHCSEAPDALKYRLSRFQAVLIWPLSVITLYLFILIYFALMLRLCYIPDW